MDILSLLATARKEGASVQATGGRIVYEHEQRAPALIAELRTREGALLTLLEAEAAGQVTVTVSSPYQPENKEKLLARIVKGRQIITDLLKLYNEATPEQKPALDERIAKAIDRLTALQDEYVFHYGQPEGIEF